MSKTCNIPNHSHLESTWAICYQTPCPACKEQVYYYQCGHGSKVWFEDLGHPWPQHDLTKCRQERIELLEKINVMQKEIEELKSQRNK